MVKKKDQTLLYVVGIILVIIFAGQTGFFASFITTCTNEEPTSDFQNSLLTILGGTSTLEFSELVTFSPENGSDILYNMAVNNYMFTTSNNITTSFDTLYHPGLTYNAYLNLIKENNTFALAIHNTKEANILNGVYYWADPNGNLIYRGNLNSFNAYAEKFIVCQVVEINETKLKIDACAEKNALYNEQTTQCYCEDGSTFDSVIGCVQETIETTSGTTSSTGSAATSAAITTTSTYVPPKEKTLLEKLTTGVTPYYLFSGLMLFILYYFYVEKGDKGLYGKKGIIKPRKGRR